ncbi:MAG: hypothetical protein H6907_15400 [Hyphomicrobiales bacterium]|nr:hypothetical protein [Hyphomicrobiales bacterium]MCP5373111.1 hypothetical protein [Hyphomicrobiales bacterium]
MRKFSRTWMLAAAAGMLLAAAGPSAATEESRELVDLPPMMRDHMLTNMRDHLAALDEILGELADGNTEAAAAIAEKRLGMSSMGLHGAAHLAKFMPPAMAQIGTQMHQAASRFVIAAQDAELEPGREAQRKVYRALQQVTENCNACHQGYRIR